MVQAAIDSVSMGRSRYGKRLVITESRNRERHVQAAIGVNAACGASEEVGAGCPHGGGHEAYEGYHGNGENT
jgi:hypothetical protein